MVTLDRHSPIPLVRQLYGQFRERILSAKLAAGTRLPASRSLARQLAVSRNVVLEAYDLLSAEGFLESRQGAGTYVAAGATLEVLSSPDLPELDRVTMGYESPPGIINFRAGTPDLAGFPRKLWLRMIREVFETPLQEMLAYGHPEGRRELREAISAYLLRQRDLVCHPDQVVVTAGTTQAIGLACQLLLKERKEVILEDPITSDIRRIAAQHGAKVLPVPVDGDGLRTALLPEMARPACIYVTPSHQFPIGGTLPIQRRIELLRYATHKDCFIIEDDYDSEFRFDGPVLSSLHSLAPDRVIYIGTFSKTLCPAIRIGYMVLPPGFISRGRRHKWQSDLHNEVISQLSLARFMAEGHYLRHLAKMRIRYRNRRGALVSCLTEHFGERVRILGSATGLHLTAEFAGCGFSAADLAEIEERGARFYGIAPHAISLVGGQENRLLIGYGNLGREEIAKGIRILAEWVKQRQPKGW